MEEGEKGEREEKTYPVNVTRKRGEERIKEVRLGTDSEKKRLYMTQN